MSQPAVDVSDSAVQDAWKQLTNDKSPVNWILLGLADGGKSNKLELIEASTAGFVDLKRKLKSISARVLFGAFAVAALDHRNASVTSKRTKFISFSYTGSSVPELLRAQSSFQKSAVNQQLLSGCHLNMEVSVKDLDSSAFSEVVIAKRLHDATAAHKPTHYSFFDKEGKELSVEDIMKGDDDSDDEFE